jgi:hypothetical protein
VARENSFHDRPHSEQLPPSGKGRTYFKTGLPVIHAPVGNQCRNLDSPQCGNDGTPKSTVDDVLDTREGVRQK